MVPAGWSTLTLRAALVTTSLALLVGTTSPASAACLQDPEDPPVSIDAPTLTVSVHAERATYRPGEVAVIEVVVRQAVAGPSGDHADIEAVLTANGKTIKKLYGKADSAGTTRLQLKLHNQMQPKTVTAKVTARIEVVQGYDCRKSLLYQYGEASADPLLRVV